MFFRDHNSKKNSKKTKIEKKQPNVVNNRILALNKPVEVNINTNQDDAEEAVNYSER